MTPISESQFAHQAQTEAHEATLQIEQSISDLKDQLEYGLEQAHEYLRIMRSPFVLFGSILVVGIFLGETLSERMESKQSL
jgi:hypothetical protein